MGDLQNRKTIRSAMVGRGGTQTTRRWYFGQGCFAAVLLLLTGAMVWCNVWIAGRASVGSSLHGSQQQLDDPLAQNHHQQQLLQPRTKPRIKQEPPSQQQQQQLQIQSLEKSNVVGKPLPPLKQQKDVDEEQQPKGQDEDQNLHLVFSTSCSVKQDWQSYVFFFQAMAVKQKGDVTRIVSGCTPVEEEALRSIFNEQIQIMSDRFHLHFTPEFGIKGSRTWQNTKYWNKPFGVRHWLEHGMGFTNQSMTSDIPMTRHDNDIVILVDPDMVLLDPFINDFSHEPLDLWTSYFHNHPEDIITRVEHGKPIAQDYAFSDAWLRAGSSNLTHVVGPNSPVLKVTKQESRVFYPAGPPYILTFRDMYRVSVHWSDFVPRLFTLSPQMMVEMYGYCLASAHLGLKHQLAKGFMISNALMGKHSEGWFFLDSDRISDPTTICAHPDPPLPYVPHVLHFCQRYGIGEAFISKYRTHHEILSCEAPLFEVPPPDAASTTNYTHFGDGSIKVYSDRDRYLQYRNAFMTCTLMKSLNKAAIHFKQHHCDQTTANYNTDWNFHTHFDQK